MSLFLHNQVILTSVPTHSEYVPILSTGLHLYIILPTFYVSLPDTSPSKFSDLRIATAGVWHNLVLVLVVLGLSEKGIGIGKYFEKIGFKDVEGGLLVVSIDSVSPFPALSSWQAD